MRSVLGLVTAQRCAGGRDHKVNQRTPLASAIRGCISASRACKASPKVSCSATNFRRRLTSAISLGLMVAISSLLNYVKKDRV